LSARTGGLWLSRVTGDRPIPIDTDADLTFAPSWSPDGEWLAYLRVKAGKAQIAKVRPSKGAAASPLADSIPAPTFYNVTSWSPDGKWIAYPGPEGLTIISPDGNTVRVVSKRRPEVFGFSKNGATLYAVFHNSAANGAEWQLASIDVATGAEKVFGSLDLPAAVGRLSGFSMHPDGKRFVFTAGVQPYDLWVLDGFQPMRTWMSRVMGR
jgi:Tol biopolymer transport system component